MVANRDRSLHMRHGDARIRQRRLNARNAYDEILREPLLEVHKLETSIPCWVLVDDHGDCCRNCKFNCNIAKQ